MNQNEEGSQGGWAGPALFISVAIAVLAFFIWFL